MIFNFKGPVREVQTSKMGRPREAGGVKEYSKNPGIIKGYTLGKLNFLLPLKRGQSWATKVMPPEPKY